MLSQNQVQVLYLYDVYWLARRLMMITGYFFLDYGLGWYRNTWNTIPVSGQKTTLSKWIMEHWIIEQSESNKNRTDRIIRWTEEQNKQKAGWIQDNKYEQQASAVPVEFWDYKDSVMRVAMILWVPTICSRDILLHAKGDHLGWINWDQMVLEMVRRGKAGPVDP